MVSKMNVRTRFEFQLGFVFYCRKSILTQVSDSHVTGQVFKQRNGK